MGVDIKSNNLEDSSKNLNDENYELQKEGNESLPPLEITPDLVSKDILNAIIEEFVLREGTNYGDVEFSLESKVSQVEKQIKKGEVKIVFDPNTESVTLMTKREFLK